MIAAIAILKRAWPYLVGALLIMAVLYGAYRHGVTTTADRYGRQIAEQDAANAAALAKAHADARTKEADAAQRQAEIETDLLKRNEDAQATADRTIADLRAGTIRLRHDLTSAQCAIASVSDIATGTAQRDATCTGGLRPDDAAFLIRFADRADAIARQLQAAQRVIDNDRLMCGGR